MTAEEFLKKRTGQKDNLVITRNEAIDALNDFKLETLKVIHEDIEKKRDNFRVGYVPTYLDEETRGYKWAIEEVLELINNKMNQKG